MASDDNQSVDSKSVFTAHFSDTNSTTGRSPSSASSTNDDDLRPAHAKPQVAKKEGKAVFRAKILLCTVLLAISFLSFFAVYSVGVQQEVDSMNSFFDGYSSEIISVTNQKVDKIFEALDAFAFSISSQASETKQYTNQSWPFYKQPRWSQSAAKLAQTSGFKAPTILLAPIVKSSELDDWERYFTQEAPIESIVNGGNIVDLSVEDLWNRTISTNTIPVDHNGLHLPIWQQYPQHQHSSQSSLNVGYDLLSDDQIRNSFDALRELGTAVFSMEDENNSEDSIAGDYLMQPIYDRPQGNEGSGDRTLVAVLLLRVKWEEYLEDLMTVGSGIIDVVLKTSCQQGTNAMEELLHEVTYQLNGPSVVELGHGDLHDSEFTDMEVVHTFVETPTLSNPLIAESRCVPKITMHIYPTKDFQQKSKHPLKAHVKGMIACLISLIPTMLFFLYDFLVGRRQRKVMDRIVQQDMIVSNVFPTAIRDRLYDRDNGGKSKRNLEVNIMNGGGDNAYNKDNGSGGAPLADLFPNTTVVFADIAGFTAWASAREPQQVFMLLESIYMAFDKIAYSRNVFKVETVGDCYVAVAGLPDPCEDHAIVACKFARDCVKKMDVLTRKLEVSLGPDTADLDLRVGIHSGQVTAGVLRGDRCRFQLFGDTVNTAARMESTGERNKVQLSKATADLLKAAGFAKWVLPRSNTVYIKGKGDMQTYWMILKSSSTKKTHPPKRKRSSEVVMSTLDETALTVEDRDSSSFAEEEDEEEISSQTEGEMSFRDDDDGDEDSNEITMSKTERLVEWNVEILSSLLCQIIASRGDNNNNSSSASSSSLTALESTIGKNGTILEEFVPIIPLKRFKEEELKQRRSAFTIDIGDEAKSQLRKYLTNIAAMYNQDNPFHNFEHASHVTASVKKLLKRIVNVDEGNGLGNSSHSHGHNQLLSPLDLVDLAGHSYGITSDPLTQFAVVFSAVVHDVDHPGVPNAQLCKEQTRQAQIYKHKSVAEQNSVELAWEMLLHDDYKQLRACIYQTKDELKRFRQLVVNTVMATDIVDKELQALRKDRWETAFAAAEDNDNDNAEESILMTADEQDADANRKATIVIEHLIQASDVSHTMQHWHIYKQWNQKFFLECYGAYKAGRAEVDPSINWYKGEIGFFDFYVIPLAKKLDSCGVFGVSSDEYLNYAMANREEWIREGPKLVERFKEAYFEKTENNKDDHWEEELPQDG